MDTRICLAPLRGVTDAVFRDAYARHFVGIDHAVTPFLTTSSGPRIKPSQLKEVLPENNSRMMVTPQILSKTADHFNLLAGALCQLGYKVVNWNLGCPYPMVAKKGRGSGMLSDPEAVAAFLERVMPAMQGRLSIKMRLGRFHADEIATLMPILNAYDLQAIIIHPRTGIQMYNGTPDLVSFEKCLHMTHHTVVYNGDITDCAAFWALQDRFPTVNEWMIGRGVIVNPFLPGLIKGHHYQAADALMRFKSFHDTLYAKYGQKLFGPSHLVNRMKGLWGYFSKAFRNGHKICKQINKTQNPYQYEAVVNAFFNAQPPWQEAILAHKKNRGKN